MRRACGAVCVALVCGACGSFAPPPAAARPACFTLPPMAHRATAFRGARLFDGEELTTGKDLLVVDGVIAATDAPPCISESGALLDEIDLNGLTVMPGLIDAHVHAGDADEALEQALVFGVTTVIDMFGPPERIRLVRAQELAGEPALASDLFGAGVLATAPGGHGTEYGIEIPTLAHAEDARPFVDARIVEGSDFVKVVVDTLVVRPEDPPMPSLGRDVVSALATAAHERGKLVVAHIGTKKDAEDALGAGVDGLEHTFLDAPLDDAMAAAIARRSVTMTPTLSMVEMHCGIATGKLLLGDTRIAPLLSEKAEKRLGRTYEWAKPVDGAAACFERAATSLRAVRGKAPILAGTDTPNGGTAFGASLHRELELLVKAGLSPREALVAATSAPARAFGLKDRGRIAVGLRADLVVVEGDPTSDVRVTRSIRAVYKRGEKVDRYAHRHY